MIEFLPSPSHVVAMRLTGTLTGPDIDRSIGTIEVALGRHRRIGVLADTTGFTDLTPEALAKDVRYSFGKIAEWSRFQRAAVITDKTWLKLWVRTTSAFVPGVEARTFEPSEADAALAWVSQVDPG
jgi:hypothetical protein